MLNGIPSIFPSIGYWSSNLINVSSYISFQLSKVQTGNLSVKGLLETTTLSLGDNSASLSPLSISGFESVLTTTMNNYYDEEENPASTMNMWLKNNFTAENVFANNICYTNGTGCSGGGMNYTNLALTNQSNDFGQNNITVKDIYSPIGLWMCSNSTDIVIGNTTGECT
jgi:hypothetical protein